MGNNPTRICRTAYMNYLITILITTTVFTAFGVQLDGKNIKKWMLAGVLFGILLSILIKYV